MNNHHPFILLDGFRLIFKPGIRAFVLLPLLSNVILFGFMLHNFYHLAITAQTQLMDYLPEWLHFTSWLIWPIAVLTAILMFIYGFTLLGNLIAAPFNAFLSEAVERRHGYESADGNLTWRRLLASIPTTMLRELQKILYSIKWWVLILILWFIPALNLLSLLITAWLLAMQYLDYPADNHRIRFKDTIKILQKHRLQSLLFGLSVALANMIPIVNILTMSASVCAATLLWHRGNFRPSPVKQDVQIIK